MKILYFAPIPYDDIKQRPQHIAEELSKSNEIWYIEPTISGIRCFIKCDSNFSSKKYDINSNLHILRLNGFFSLHPKLYRFDPYCISDQIEYIQLRKLVVDADIIWIGYELWYRLLFRKHKKKILVFDKMDDNIQLEKNFFIKEQLKIWNKQLERDADIIFVTAKKFYDELEKKREDVYLLPNGVEAKWKNIKYSPETKKRMVIGYVGMISHWFDVDAVTKLAKARSDVDILLVGPNYMPEIKLKNVRYIGEIPKYEVPKWIERFDICLYPFKKNALLDTIDPVKIYEYLMFNKPILAIDSIEIRKYGNRIYRYKTVDELVSYSKKNLKTPFKTTQEKLEFFEDNTWMKRKESIEKILNERRKIENKK